MPHFFDNILVVTDEELVPMFWSKTGLKQAINRYKDKPYGLNRIQIGGNGRKRLIEFDSLPQHIKEYIGDPRVVKHILVKYYEEDAEAYKYYNNSDGEGFVYPDGSHLKPETISKLIVNASMMKALQSLAIDREIERRNKGASVRGLLRSIHYDSNSFKEVMVQRGEEPHTLPTTYKHFKTTYDGFKENGYISLIKDAKGTSKINALKFDEDHEALLNNLFGTQPNKPNLTKIAFQYAAFLEGNMDIVNAETGEFYNPKDFKPLALSTIKEQLSKWEQIIGTYAKRSGNRQKLIGQFVPYHSFERPTFAGSIISIDDRQPPFEYAKGKRPWFYIGVDLASGAITTWVYGKSKEGIIVDFYRQMVRNYHQWGLNLPLELECESSLNASFRETILKPGAMFEHVRIIANNAREKRIERDFGDLRNIIEKDDEAWIARPFARKESEQASSAPKQIIPFDELIGKRLMDIETVNNMPHATEKNTSRWDYFRNNQNPDTKPTNYKAILPYIGHQTKTSCHSGIIKLNNSLFIIADNGQMSTGESLIRSMKVIEDKDIVAYWLDDNYGSVLKAMVFVDGRYICELIEKPRPNKAKAERTEKDELMMQDFARYVKTITAFQQKKKNALEKVEIIDRTSRTISNSFSIMNNGSYQPRQETQEEPMNMPLPSTNYQNTDWKDQYKV